MLTEQVREFVRWGIKSGIGLGINLLLLTVWVDYGGIRPEFAIWINWAILSVYGYVVTHQWVFDDTKAIDGVRGHARQFIGMQGILGVGKAVNYVVFVALIWVGLDYRVAWVLGAVVGLVVNFGGNRTWWTATDGCESRASG